MDSYEKKLMDRYTDSSALVSVEMHRKVGGWTAYYNGWNETSIMEYVVSRNLVRKMVVNTDSYYIMDMGNGETYKMVTADYNPGSFPFTEKFYINGTLVQISRHF